MNTKFSNLITLFVITAILLSGCGSAAAATVSESNGLTTATKLALGTLKLEGTTQVVTSSQAAELLTLWQAYQSLGGSDTSSQVELDALVKQIEGTMTADQLNAIEAMNLNERSISEVLQTMQAASSSNTPSSTPNASTLSQSAPAGGQGAMPANGGSLGGTPPDGGGGSMGDITSGITTESTPAATQASASTQSTQVDGRLLNVLIQLLETRSQSKG